MNSKGCIHVAALSLAFGMMSVGCDDDAKLTWKDVLQKCANADTIGNTVYFGPSNNIGPGSVWRQTDEGYNVTWLLRHLESDEVQANELANSGTRADCEGSRVTVTSFGAGFGLESQLAPVEAGLGVDYKRAKKVVVSVGGWQWDQLIEGPFHEAVQALPPTASYKSDVVKENRLVLVKALRVFGMEADLEFSSEVAADLKAKYSGPTAKLGESEIGLDVKTSWVSETKLRVATDGDFYLAGEFGRYSDTGFAGPEDVLQPVELAPNLELGVDPTIGSL